jgi:hypothetical protein
MKVNDMRVNVEIRAVMVAGSLLIGGAANAQLTTFVIEFGNVGANAFRNDQISSFDVLGASTTLTLQWNPATGTPNPDTSIGIGNGLAADVLNNRIFWRAGNNSAGTTEGSGSLFVWDRNNNTQRIITAAPGFSLPATNASNAAFYNGAYWFIAQGTDTLTRLELDFTNPLAPVFRRRDITNFDGGASGVASLSFGDIVISSSGILYGSTTNRFFRADLSAITQATGSVTGFQTISTSSALNMQMVLSQDEQTLYGARNNTVPNTVSLFSVNPTNGSESLLKTFTGVRFTDLTGVYPTGSLIVAPEPGSLVLLLPLIAGGMLRIQRRRTK